MILTPEEKSAFKLAQLQAVSNRAHIRVFENILKQEGDVNFAIPVDSHDKCTKPSMKGYTALHYSCLINNIKLFNCLLTHGAEFTKTNYDGQTVIHMVIGNQKKFKEPLDNLLVNAVLSAHVNTSNFSNPSDKDGLTHFHVACMTRHSASVKFFLDNGASIDEPVSKNSKFSPGFTPLHLAAMCSNTTIAELLVANGANLHIKNAREMTPLHLLIERRLQMYDSIGNALREKGNSHEKLQQQILENEKIICMLLENMSSDNDCVDTIGFSNFHVACTLQDTSVAENLVDRVADLDHCVNMNSQLWPGYTALHFAAHVSIKIVELLMDNGANIEAKDSRGLTPLDICMERYKFEDIFSIKSLSAKYENLAFSDGRTKVLSFIHQMTDPNQLRKFLGKMQDINTRIPTESPLWPGFTPLHLVVLCAERSKLHFHEDRQDKKAVDLQIIRRCFSLGADLGVHDSQGRSALHLAFRLNKTRTVDAILRLCCRIPDVADEDNLTHIHVVCSTNCSKSRLKKCHLDDTSANAVYRGDQRIGNVRPGATPLHVLLAGPEHVYDLQARVRMLLKSGADLNVKDANGLTPVHRLLERDSSTWDYKFMAASMLTKVIDDCVVEEYRLSYLQVACHMRNQAAVKRLMKKGANVNLSIEYTGKSDDESVGFLSRYHKCTPLHLTHLPIHDEDKLLVDRGADVFAEKADGTTALEWGPTLHYFLETVQNNAELRERVRRKFGWTRLHVLCYFMVVDGFERAILGELDDINARVHENSPFWKGYTPLHLLMYRGQNYKVEKVYEMSRVLLDNGADVTLLDCDGNTPISMMFEHSVSDKTCKQAALLMIHHHDFNVNPVNGLGISHFHLACYFNDFVAVEGFLSCGVNVNRPIDYFSSWCPGFTPLHLASQSRVVDLLISHGADIHIEDVNGCNVLAEAIRRHDFDEDVVTKILENGANINGVNARGQTPFEIAISKGRMTVEKLKFCIERGFHVNSCNSISGLGYLAIVLADYTYPNEDLRMDVVEIIANEKSTADFGRSTLHNIVTGTSSCVSIGKYVKLFEKLVKLDCDLDVQDDEGKTALHLAVKFTNPKAVTGLLACGADINVLDVNGKSVLSFVSTMSCLRDMLTVYTCKLAYLKLDICAINAAAIARTSIHNFTGSSFFFEKIKTSKMMNVGVRSIRLYDFLTETGAIMIYPRLNESERRKIEQFFEVVGSDAKFREIIGILKLQYRKAVKRAELLSSAMNSLRLMLGFDLPDLCVDSIFQYLRNSELKNIISAEVGREDMRMDVK